MQEYIPLGQRVSSYSVECFDGEKWMEISKQSTIGYKRLILTNSPETNGKAFPKSSKIRLVITGSKASPVINTLGIIGGNEL